MPTHDEPAQAKQTNKMFYHRKYYFFKLSVDVKEEKNFFSHTIFSDVYVYFFLIFRYSLSSKKRVNERTDCHIYRAFFLVYSTGFVYKNNKSKSYIKEKEIGSIDILSRHEKMQKREKRNNVVFFFCSQSTGSVEYGFSCIILSFFLLHLSEFCFFLNFFDS